MSSRRPPVVIIGAGVGGLTLALLLRERGIDAEVLEQSTELREVGAAVALTANGMRALDRYTARRRVRTRQLQAMSWATSAALHLPDGPAARCRDESLAGLPERLAWIHGHDALGS